MNIKSITITAEASKAYQKYCVALTAENLVEGDVDRLKDITISESLRGINELAGNIGQAEVTTSIQNNPYTSEQKQSNYPTNSSSYRRMPVQDKANYAPVNNYNTSQDSRANKPASEKQISYIQSLGYKGIMPRTFLEADELLKKLKAERGIN